MIQLEPETKQELVPFQQLTWRKKLSLIAEVGYSSIPNIGACTAGPLINTINIHFLKKYGDDELVAGYGLGMVFQGAMVFAMIVSLNQAGNVLMAQAFGAKNYRACGISFQRSIILLALILTPLLFTMLFADKIMMAFSISEPVAKILVSYTRITLFAFIGTACFDSMKAFITSQKVFYPIIYIQLFNIVIHFFWAKLFIDWLQLGVQGAALCRVIEEWTVAIVLFVYIKKSNKFWKTWIPWTKEAFDKVSLWNHLKFSVPIAGMTYFNWLYFEVMTLIAGTFGTKEVVSHVAVANTSGINFQMGLGISITMMTYVANAVGKQSIIEAKNYFYAGMSIIVPLAIFMVSILLPNRTAWAEFWSLDPNTQVFLANVFTVYCLGSLWIDTINNGQNALLRAIGKQKIASFISFITLYPIGVPLMIFFAFVLDFKVKGLWIAFAIANTIGGISCLLNIRKVDWEQVMAEAKERLKAQDNVGKELEESDKHHQEKLLEDKV